MKAFLYAMTCVGWTLCSSAHTDGFLAQPETRSWHAVIGLAGGFGGIKNPKHSQSFPIQNPATDEYYHYTSDKQTKTSALSELFLGAERPFFSSWIVQGGLAYTRMGSVPVNGLFLQGADPGSTNDYTWRYDVREQVLLAQAKMMYSGYGRFYPWLLMGLGASFYKTSGFATNVPPFLAFTREYANHNSNSLAYRAGLGMDMDISAHMRVGLSYRFSGLGQIRTGAASINAVAVAGTLSQSGRYSNDAMFQLTYRL